jgi:MOSC domain-containing protein YiiM
MQLISVNVGTVQPIKNGKPSGKTGIYKIPTVDPVEITPLGLQGDAIVDTDNHGGVDQAVYVFTMPDYVWWSGKLGYEVGPGTFGENLTISDLESAALHIGDRFRIGSVVLEVTSPRIPCVTIAARMQDPQFVKKFRYAEKPGVYCRVIVPGIVRAGDSVELIQYPGELVSVIELFRGFYEKDWTSEQLHRILSTPVHFKERPYYEAMLSDLVAQGLER